ncbi:MAG TPA: tetratricopeptide repeat protein [Woeseiaceae bacterium]|nr:tetratricopeptide repeat protein [Woeseiaceae bacterium]
MTTASKLVGFVCSAIVCFAILHVAVADAEVADTVEIAATPASKALLSNAEHLVATGDSVRAYALLSAKEAQFAGDPYFDYLLGVAALDTGHASDAIFSLRRSLGVAPQFSAARLELARAYFETGNTELARPLFVDLLDEKPPAAVRSVIDNYIATIDARQPVSKAQFVPYVAAGAGYDSNANVSTDDQQFFGFTLSPNNVATDSAFTELAAGFNAAIRRSTQFAWLLSGRASYRHNPDASFVDPTVLSGYGGFNWQRGRYFGRAGGDGYYGLLDGDFNESYAGADLMAGNSITDRWDLLLGLRYGAVRHDDSIEVLDVDRLLYTVSARYRISPLAGVALEVLGGEDSARQVGSPYGNSKAGLSISVNAPIGTAFLFASVGTLHTDFDGDFFGEPRNDEQLSAIAQLEFRDIFADGLSLMPRLRYINNDSDVSLYEYDRTEIGVQLQWTPQ